MLRTIRLSAAIVCFTLITLLFLDFTGTLHTWFGWLAKIQFLPALLALNIGVVLFWHGFNKSIGTGKMTGMFYFFVSSIFIAPTQIFFNCTRK